MKGNARVNNKLGVFAVPVSRHCEKVFCHCHSVHTCSYYEHVCLTRMPAAMEQNIQEPCQKFNHYQLHTDSGTSSHRQLHLMPIRSISNVRVTPPPNPLEHIKPKPLLFNPMPLPRELDKLALQPPVPQRPPKPLSL